MAGYSRLYCLGGLGGFGGSDGINPIGCQIWVGDADRQWWEVHYFDESLSPLGEISVIVPAGPDHPNALIDSCLAFVPDLFGNCPSMADVRREAAGLSRLDFDRKPKEIPAGWDRLRGEGRPKVKTLNIFEAELRRLEVRSA